MSIEISEISKVPSVSGGLSKHRIYQNFYLMHYRINNENHPSYSRYKAKNIKVCPRWVDFNNFITDLDDTYQEGYVLDRIDNEGDYSPGNCQWVTRGWNAAKDLSISVNQYSLQGIYERTFHSYEDAGRHYGVGANGFRRANKLLVPYKSKRFVSLTDTENLTAPYMAGTININGHAILQHDMQGNVLHEYATSSAAANDLKISDASISQAVHGKVNHAGGFRWSMVTDPNTGYDGILHPLQDSKVLKKVVMYERVITLKEVATFDSVAAAAIHVGSAGSNITAVCNGKKKTCMGYVFKHV